MGLGSPSRLLFLSSYHITGYKNREDGEAGRIAAQLKS
jgi:hypothetical protein